MKQIGIAKIERKVYFVHDKISISFILPASQAVVSVVTDGQRAQHKRAKPGTAQYREKVADVHGHYAQHSVG